MLSTENLKKKDLENKRIPGKMENLSNWEDGEKWREMIKTNEKIFDFMFFYLF